MTKRRCNLTQTLELNQFFKGQKTEIPVTKEEANFYKNKLYLQNQEKFGQQNRASFLTPKSPKADQANPIFEKDSFIYIENILKELKISKNASSTPRSKVSGILSEDRSSNRHNENPYNLEMSRLIGITPRKLSKGFDPQFSARNLKHLFTGKPLNLKIEQYIQRKSQEKIMLDNNSHHFQLLSDRSPKNPLKASHKIQLNELTNSPRKNKEVDSIEEFGSPKRFGKHLKSASLGGHRKPLNDQQLVPIVTFNLQPSPVQGWTVQKIENNFPNLNSGNNL